MRRLLALVVLLWASPAVAAQVTLDAPTHRGGQTFVTWTEVTGGGITYDVYRSPVQITSLSGLTPIATGLTQDSGRYLYSDAADDNLTSGFIISDNGSHLASNKGLFVHTTGELCSAVTIYYAVVNSGDASVTVGVNSLTTGVTESCQTVRGAIRLSSTTDGSGNTVYHYFAWENYAIWVTSEFGYYGHRFNVIVPNSGSTAPFPLYLYLHAAGSTQYLAPNNGWNAVAPAVIIRPVDMDWTGFTDPYTGNSLGLSKWFGRFDTAADLWKSVTEDRIIRYVKMVRDNLTGDSVNYQINSNRIYTYGASLGSGSMHVASHYPDLFAAAAAGIGWLTNSSWAPYGNTTKKVNSASGPTLTEYLDMAYYAANSVLPPIIYPFSAFDNTISPALYTTYLPLFETYHQAYMAQWQDSDHAEFAPTYTSWDWSNAGNGIFHFALNEAYPAFSSVANSVTVPSLPSHNAGQRNGYMDWDSPLHNLGGGTNGDLFDTSYRFGISMQSTSGSNTTGTVTIRNQQAFLPVPGAMVAYVNYQGLAPVFMDAAYQFGTTAVNADGSITITSLTIASAGNRLVLTAENNADDDYTSLSVCGTYGTSVTFAAEAWTIPTTTATVPASSDNFKLLRAGNWVNGGSARGFVYVVQGGSLYSLGIQGRWYKWNGSSWAQAGDAQGYVGANAVGCRLPASTSGSIALQNNIYLIDAYGGNWIAACSEEPLTYGYGLYCPDFPSATLERGIIVRNGARFPDPNGQASKPEPNNTPWDLKYCNGTMYLLEWDGSPAYSKWVGPGQNTWLNAAGDACLDDAPVLTKRRLRFRTL